MSSVGKLIYELRASDQDTGPAGQLQYQIAAGNKGGNFKLNQISNGAVEIQSNSEGLKPGSYNLSIIVSDGQSPIQEDETFVLVVVVKNDEINCTNENFGESTAA